MSNALPCGLCVHYDPLLGPGEKDTQMGWCSKRSVYPHREGPGQVFPPDVARVAVGALARPYIVQKEKIIDPCEHVRQGHDDPVEKKRRSQTTLDKQGRRVLS